jgi:hypothetical protein
LLLAVEVAADMVQMGEAVELGDYYIAQIIR